MSDDRLLRWHATEDTNAVVVQVAGEIDLATEGDFAEALSRGLSGHAPVILVDLSGVTFLGSSALNVLLEADREAGQQQRTLRVVHGGAFAARVFSVAGLDQVLNVYETVAQALGSARAAKPADRGQDFGIRDAL